jgi:BirA family biotin operon repressor/biotin-[acetyl-CoA-carboxylase] ligase
MLEANKIKFYSRQANLDVEVLQAIDSTNDYIKKYRGSDEIKFCFAEMQTKGKGRLNREWHSPAHKNIYMSCLYPFQKNINELAGLSLVVGLAIVETLKTYGIARQLVTKWPNDVLYAQKKISGTLIEIQSQVVIGIGINVNMLDDDVQINQAWTSMQKILGVQIDRNELAARLIDHLMRYLDKFNQHGFSVFVDEWLSVDSLMHQHITLKNVSDEISGEVVGVNEVGQLVLRLADGDVQVFTSGDVSVVKK